MMAILLVLAGLMGAAGITVAAIGVHAFPGAGLDDAGNMLLFHAAAVVGVVAAVDRCLLSRPVGLLAAAGLVVGAVLFSGDVTLPVYVGYELFPGAAPTGGVLLIVSWVAVALAAAIPPAKTA